jgi:hypothetical protein
MSLAILIAFGAVSYVGTILYAYVRTRGSF